MQVLCATVFAQSVPGTYEVKYSTDTLAHEGVGGTNYQPTINSLTDGKIHNLWLNKFPVEDVTRVSSYKPS